MLLKLVTLWCAISAVLVFCDEHVEHAVVEESNSGDNMSLPSDVGIVSDSELHSKNDSDSSTTTVRTTSSELPVDATVATTVSSKDLEDTETKSPTTVSNPPVASTTYKLDPKKDTKKKNKMAFKKKDKNYEDGVFVETTDKSVETTPSVKTTTFVETTTLAESTTSVEITSTVDETSETVQDMHTTIPPVTYTESTDDAALEATTIMHAQPDMLHMDIKEEMVSTPQEDILTKDTSDSVVEAKAAETTTMQDHQFETTTNLHLTETTMEEEAQTTLPSVETDMSGNNETTLTHVTDITTTPEDLIVTENNNHDVTTVQTETIDVSKVEVKKLREDDSSDVQNISNLTTEQEDELNGLGNDLDDKQREVTTFSVTMNEDQEITTTIPLTVRKQKQMNLENAEESCPCNEPKIIFDPSKCAGERTTPDPNCPCRSVCARQTGESCSPGEPCDEEFGLQCNLQNNTCH
ncbi:hypothetical protein X975_10325, partial [Stegodyphus mimosarum]